MFYCARGDYSHDLVWAVDFVETKGKSQGRKCTENGGVHALRLKNLFDLATIPLFERVSQIFSHSRRFDHATGGVNTGGAGATSGTIGSSGITTCLWRRRADLDGLASPLT
jgi:hypothetical protein